MENRPKETQTQSQFNELALNLIQTNKAIFQTIVLLISDGLNWSDSLCSFRLMQIGSSLLERFPITSTASPSSFSLHLDTQIAQQFFTCCLSALQIHGEHQDIANQLMSYALLICDRSPPDYRRSVYYHVLEQIPNVNKHMLDEFIGMSLQVDTTNPRKSTGAINYQEKMRKEMFKKIVQPIIGKSLGQLYKQEIRIRVLQPLNLKTKRRLNVEQEERTINSADISICSLFDPANKD